VYTLTGLEKRFGSLQMHHKRAHDHQRTFRTMIAMAATEHNIQLIVKNIITSHEGIAYHRDTQMADRDPNPGLWMVTVGPCQPLKSVFYTQMFLSQNLALLALLLKH